MTSPRSIGYRRGGLLAFGLALLLGGCATGPDALVDDPGIRMAVPRSVLYDGARANFDRAIALGTLKGTSSFPWGGADSNIQAAVKDSLYINGLLASDAAAARYRIDLDVNFALSGLFEKEATATVRYRVIPTGSSEPVLDKTFQSSDTQVWELYDKAGPVVALLFTSQADLMKMRAPGLSAVRNNIVMFLDALSQWQPADLAHSEK